MDHLRAAKRQNEEGNGSQTEFRPMRSITVGAIDAASRANRSGSRTKRSSDLSGAEIIDHIQSSDSDSPRRRDGSGVQGAANPSTVTLGIGRAKNQDSQVTRGAGGRLK